MAKNPNPAPNPTPNPNPTPGARRHTVGNTTTSPKAQPQSQSSDGQHTFCGEDTEYADDEWLVPSRDAKGNYERVTINIPPWLNLKLNQLAANHAVPYESVHDLIRHALARHVCWMGHHFLAHTVTPHDMSIIHTIGAVAMEEAYRRETEEKVTGLVKEARVLLNRGDLGEARKLASRVTALLHGMTPTKWKVYIVQRLRTELTEMFGNVDQFGAMPMDRQQQQQTQTQAQPAKPVHTATPTATPTASTPTPEPERTPEPTPAPEPTPGYTTLVSRRSMDNLMSPTHTPTHTHADADVSPDPSWFDPGNGYERIQ